MVWLKDLASIYSVSDFEHTVVTPAQLLLCQYLEQAPILTIHDAMSGIAIVQILQSVFISPIYFQYIVDSKRYIPEVMTFLLTLLSEFAQKFPNYKSFPLLSTVKTSPFDFSIRKPSVECIAFDFNLLFQETAMKKSDSLKLTILMECIGLLIQFAKFYSDTITFIELFNPILPWLALFPDSFSKSVIVFMIIFLMLGANFSGS